MWMARYPMLRTHRKKYGVGIEFHCKLRSASTDWNGSGMHCNFLDHLYAP